MNPVQEADAPPRYSGVTAAGSSSTTLTTGHGGNRIGNNVSISSSQALVSECVSSPYRPLPRTLKVSWQWNKWRIFYLGDDVNSKMFAVSEYSGLFGRGPGPPCLLLHNGPSGKDAILAATGDTLRDPYSQPSTLKSIVNVSAPPGSEYETKVVTEIMVSGLMENEELVVFQWEIETRRGQTAEGPLFSREQFEWRMTPKEAIAEAKYPREFRLYRLGDLASQGCYECSQRRVSCDRTEPHCQKCISKGLKCSGLDIRYRFTNGIATRGKWVGKTIQNVYAERQDSNKHQERDDGAGYSTFHFEPLQPKEATPKAQRKAGRNGSLITSTLGYLDFSNNTEQLPPKEGSCTLTETEDCQSENKQTDTSVIDNSVTLVHPSNDSLDSPTWFNSGWQLTHEPLPDNIPLWKRQLFMHYSKHIAREMLAIDGAHNGWRHLVLPVAHGDELVMNAVLTVSAFHLSLGEPMQIQSKGMLSTESSLCTPDGCPSADVLYARTIKGLQQRRELAGVDYAARQSVLLAILVLLISVMVNGRKDFPLLFGMLQSALEAVGGEGGLGGGELGGFMVRQIRKLRVYAAPLLSEQSGLETLAAQAHWGHIFDCLNHCSQSQPDHAGAVSVITDIVQQAHDIYIRQAVSNFQRGPSANDWATSIQGIQRFKETLEAFPKDSPGQQVLIWATFIAASDCILDEHKAFFESLLMQHHARSGFLNVVKGLKHLRNIWARKSQGDKWTRLLPQAQMFLM
ncbi:acriflavine sensitivity control acr-2 [Fusarium albosuccineum]|uniref:Acriflavine sensitivity control acr-2 n=1 Tax=Fusarium albosuccineum TaxID=1237068 RepID=A0A8H4LMT9_9HYPO|nr:acriflavine sensitivity control acr-2 [Fusarium albosuccineum]